MQNLDSVALLKRRLLLRYNYDAETAQLLSQVLAQNSEMQNSSLVGWILSLLSGDVDSSVIRPRVFLEALARCALTNQNLRRQIFTAIPTALGNPSLLFSYIDLETRLTAAASATSTDTTAATSATAVETVSASTETNPENAGGATASAQTSSDSGDKKQNKKKKKKKKVIDTKKPKIGRQQRKSIGEWYMGKDVMTLALHVTKYRQRYGWSHRDLMRLAHVKYDMDKHIGQSLVLHYAHGGISEMRKALDALPAERKGSTEVTTVVQYLEDIELVRHSADEGQVVELINKHKLVHEHVPTPLRKSIQVWRALVTHMPVMATIRNLSHLSSLSLLDDSSPHNCVQPIIDRLTNAELLLAARVHPISILIALREYEKGYDPQSKAEHRQRIIAHRTNNTGVKNIDKLLARMKISKNNSATNTENPVERPKIIPANPKIVSALNTAFLNSFGSVESTGGSIVVAVELSSAMTCGGVLGCTSLTPLQASAALATLLFHREKQCRVVAVLPDKVSTLCLAGKPTLGDVEKQLQTLLAGVGGTRAQGGSAVGRLMTWAIERGGRIDSLILLTNQKSRNKGANIPGSAAGKGANVPNVAEKGANVSNAAGKGANVPNAVGKSTKDRPALENVNEALSRYHTTTSSTATRLVYVCLTALESADGLDDSRVIRIGGFQPALPDIMASFMTGRLDPVPVVA